MTPKILLASGSPRRIKLLTQFGYRVIETIPSRAEEALPESHEVDEVVVDNARLKGREVVNRLKTEGRSFENDVVLLAADTLVALDHKVYPKPSDMAEAEQFMHELGGKAHRVLTGVFLQNLGTGRQHSFCGVTHVTLVKMTVAEMHKVWEVVDPLDKAGAYAYQDAPNIVQEMNGSETNVIGLPMEQLAEELPKVL
ncbi:MAG: Maf family protein [Acidobacteriota bacterium]|nr:Maf family protein [Acidobacteriota bacterium]